MVSKDIYQFLDDQVTKTGDHPRWLYVTESTFDKLWKEVPTNQQTSFPWLKSITLYGVAGPVEIRVKPKSWNKP